MIKLIEGSYASFFPREIDAMLRHRAEIFDERLGWVKAKNGRERDGFDDMNPLYLISVDPETEAYQGSVRLLPTTGPNMLRDVFPQLLDGETIESRTIWESSRVCATKAGVFAELIAGMDEVVTLAGMTKVVTVIDERVKRVLQMMQVPFKIMGTPKTIGNVTAYAVLIDNEGSWLDALRERWTIPTPNLCQVTRAIAFGTGA